MQQTSIALVVSAFLASQPRGGEELSLASRTLQLDTPLLRLVLTPLDAGPTADIAVLQKRPSGGLTLTTLSGDGGGGFFPAHRKKLEQFVYQHDPVLVAADPNEDGFGDLAMTESFPGPLLLGDGTLEYTDSVSLPTLGGSQHGVGFTDIDGDGLRDSVLVVNDISELFLDYGINSGNGTFGSVGFVSSPGTVALQMELLFADLDGDGRDATVLTGGSGVAHSGFPGGPNSNDLLLPGDYTDVVAADMNGDGYLDLASAGPSENSVVILCNDGFGEFGDARSTLTGRTPESLAAGDLNGDGWMDLVAANRAGNNVAVLFGDGSGAVSLETHFATAVEPVDVAVADIDFDGDVDVVVACRSSASLTVLYNE